MEVLPGGQAASKTALTSRPGSRTRARRRGPPPPPRTTRSDSRDIGDPEGSDQPPTSATAERRNERERNRVKLVNLGFAHLRRHVPLAQGASKKMSKVETLRSAVDYIRELESLLGARRSLGTSDGLSPQGSSSADSPPPRSPRSRASSVGEGSGDSSSLAEYLTMHSWG